MRKTKKLKKFILDKMIIEKQGFKIQGLVESNLLTKKIELTNRKISKTVYIIIIILIILNILAFITEYNSQNFFFGKYFFNNSYYFLITLIILVYILFSNPNYYNIKINTEGINIRNHKLITGIFSSKNFFNVSKKNLLDYSFTNHSLSFNKTLFLKIKYEKGKVLSKSFILSFLSRKEELRIKKYLEKLLARNKPID